MCLYRRGRIWWFHFEADGHHHQESSHVTNKAVAAGIEAAKRLEVAKAHAGSHRPGSFALARELHHIAEILGKLGTADTGTTMGAINLLSEELKEGIKTLRVHG
jgi:hypothetical protein